MSPTSYFYFHYYCHSWDCLKQVPAMLVRKVSKQSELIMLAKQETAAHEDYVAIPKSVCVVV